jgi:hypothetical protein
VEGWAHEGSFALRSGTVTAESKSLMAAELPPLSDDDEDWGSARDGAGNPAPHSRFFGQSSGVALIQEAMNLKKKYIGGKDVPQALPTGAAGSPGYRESRTVRTPSLRFCTSFFFLWC